MDKNKKVPKFSLSVATSAKVYPPKILVLEVTENSIESASDEDFRGYLLGT